MASSALCREFVSLLVLGFAAIIVGCVVALVFDGRCSQVRLNKIKSFTSLLISIAAVRAASARPTSCICLWHREDGCSFSGGLLLLGGHGRDPSSRSTSISWGSHSLRLPARRRSGAAEPALPARSQRSFIGGAFKSGGVLHGLAWSRKASCVAYWSSPLPSIHVPWGPPSERRILLMQRATHATTIMERRVRWSFHHRGFQATASWRPPTSSPTNATHLSGRHASPSSHACEGPPPVSRHKTATWLVLVLKFCLHLGLRFELFLRSTTTSTKFFGCRYVISSSTATPTHSLPLLCAVSPSRCMRL